MNGPVRPPASPSDASSALASSPRVRIAERVPTLPAAAAVAAGIVFDRFGSIPAGLTFLVTLAAALAFSATSAVAQISSIESSRSSGKAPKDPNKPICERVEQIGTRLGARRVCMTAAQWAEQRREQREDMERVQRIVNQAPSDPSGN